jgi:hypothetical protein
MYLRNKETGIGLHGFSPKLNSGRVSSCLCSARAEVGSTHSVMALIVLAYAARVAMLLAGLTESSSCWSGGWGCGATFRIKHSPNVQR